MGTILRAFRDRWMPLERNSTLAPLEPRLVVTPLHRVLRGVPVLALLGVGFAVQVHFLSSYPQPVLFGDPGAYYVVGQKIQQAAARLAEGERFASVFESIRGLLYFAGVGSVYGVIDALRPKDIEHFRIVLAGFNTGAMLLVFLLGRRLAGSYAAGLLTLAMAAIYPPFSVQTGRIFPDPITACAFAGSALFYLRGVQEKSAASMLASGLALGAGLLIRTQLIQYVGTLFALALLGTAPIWWRSHRKLGLALALGLLPAAALWLGIVRATGGDLTQIEAFGNFTFQQRYPYGFWQFLETDGFMGPYRLGEEPYYRELELESETTPELLTSYPKQLAFTLQYVASRGSESLLLFLDNIYRLYDRPANDYKWDYPMAYPRQVGYQRVILVLAVAGISVFAAAHPAYAGAFFIPACLALLHGLSYPWPRFNQPAMPILIAGAGAFLVWTLREAPRPRAALVALAGLLAAAALLLLATAARMDFPELARVLRFLGILCGIAAPFAIAALASRRSGPILAAGLGLSVLAVAHEVRSQTWHETELRLGDELSAIEQTIALSPEGLSRLRQAAEVFVVFDLLIPDGSPRGLSAVVNGRELAHEEWTATMPRFGESTAAGGRDRRGYRQWWGVRLPPEILEAASSSIRIVLRSIERPPVVVYGDRFEDQKRVYEGPSFGDWPHLAQVKLEYDGDYRLSVRRPLASSDSSSFVVSRDGSRSEFPGVHRIRLIELGTNEGRLSWETEPARDPGTAAIAFYAYSGTRGSAEMLLEATKVLTFPLGSAEDFDFDAPPHRLCHRSEPSRGGMAYGGYVLFTPAEGARPRFLTVRFRSGMSIEPLFFSLDQRDEEDRLRALVSECMPPPDAVPVDGVSRILDATRNRYPEDTGRWSVVSVH
jgi:4-amino-4-deoxy-L-arabinose transferase-like glycosyltransferase